MSAAQQVDTSNQIPAEQRFVGKSAALLLLLSLVSGGYVAGAMTGQFPVDARMALGAHVTGLIGALLLFAYAWSLPLLRLSHRARRWVAWALVVGNFGNLIIGSAKAIPAVHGVAVTEDLANNVVFGLLNLFVVIPLFGAAGAWVYGFRR